MAYVQSKKTVQGPAATIAATFTSNVGAAQRLLLAAVGWFNGGDNINHIATVRDTLGTAFSLAIFKGGPNSSLAAAIYYGLSPSGGADTVTVTWDATQPNFQRLVITEVSENATTSPFDAATATETGTSSTMPNSGAITPAGAGEFIFGFLVNNTNGVTQTAGTNETFALRESNTVDIGIASEDVVQATGAATSAQFTLSSADVWNCVVAAFKPAALGGWSIYRPYTLGAAALDVLTGGLYYYWRRRKQEKPDE